MAYDFLITFSTEANYVWLHTFTPITVIFFFVRYMPMVDSILLLIRENAPITSKSVYSMLFTVQGWFYAVGYLFALVIFILRTCAIWENDIRIACFLSALLIGVAIPELYVVNRYLNKIQFYRSPFRVPGFLMSNIDRVIIVPYISFVFFETVILIFTLLKMKKQQGKSDIYRILYRDSLIFYILLLSLSIFNIVFLIVGPGVYNLLFLQLHRILHSVLLGRVVLNIRSAISLTTRNNQIPSNDSNFLFGESGVLTSVRHEDFLLE